MPLKTGELTEQEATFVEHYADTLDATYAATKAGYSHPYRKGVLKKQDPRIVEAARDRAKERLMSEGAEIGVAVLIEVASDKKAPANARVAAADKLVKHSGISADVSAAGELHEMTPDQIAAAIQRLEARAAGMAKDVTPGSIFD